MVIPVEKHTNGDSGESILHNKWNKVLFLFLF